MCCNDLKLIIFLNFYALSQRNHEKRMLAFSYLPHLSVHPHRITRLPKRGTSLNYYWKLSTILKSD
jgi:hypothetical protein